MPFLMGGDLVARVDLKAERKESTLWVRSAHLEEGRDSGAVARELALQLKIMSQWLGLERVRVDESGDLGRDLLAAVGRG